MIVQERLAGRDLIITYSDSGYMIEQVETGYRYAGAVDPDYMHREYVETDERIGENELRSMEWERQDRDYDTRIGAIEDALCEMDMEAE